LALILLTNRIPVEVLQFCELPAARPGAAQRQRIASCFHKVQPSGFRGKSELTADRFLMESCGSSPISAIISLEHFSLFP
jgi:hypothetical protein